MTEGKKSQRDLFRRAADFIKKNPKVALAMKLFGITYAEYQRSLRAMQDISRLSVGSSTTKQPTYFSFSGSTSERKAMHWYHAKETQHEVIFEACRLQQEMSVLTPEGTYQEGVAGDYLVLTSEGYRIMPAAAFEAQYELTPNTNSLHPAQSRPHDRGTLLSDPTGTE